MKLVKTVVFLTERQIKYMESYRARIGVSLSEAMRRFVDEMIDAVDGRRKGGGHEAQAGGSQV